MKRFWLEWGEARFCLEPGSIIIGRGSTAHLVVNDALVSRQHARITVSLDSVTIEDLSSANGVHVNKKRIEKQRPLSTGDEIRIGTVDFELKADEIRHIDRSSFTPITMPGACGLISVHPSVTPAEGDHTAKVHVIDTLGAVVDKILALGRGEEAERILANTLKEVLANARSGRADGVPRHVYSRAAHYAIRLAATTNRPRWVEYTIELYTELCLTLPAELIDQLYITVRQIPNMRVSLLDTYLETLRKRNNLNPSERFLLQRIEGLRNLIAVGVRS